MKKGAVVGVRQFSFGSGVDSVAALVLAARGEIDYKHFGFANVGADSENPSTLDYFYRVALPYAKASGLSLVELFRTSRDRKPLTIYGQLTRPDSRSLGIPVRMSNGKPGRRSCTRDFKVEVVRKRARELGARAITPATIGVGIAYDELSRMRADSGYNDQVLEYPLVDLRLTRADCKSIIADAGLPEPDKSACYFCPFHRKSEWFRLRDEQPELFEKAAALEDTLNQTRKRIGKDDIYFTQWGRSLRDEIGSQSSMFSALAENENEDAHSCAPFACSAGL